MAPRGKKPPPRPIDQRLQAGGLHADGGSNLRVRPSLGVGEPQEASVSGRESGHRPSQVESFRNLVFRVGVAPKSLDAAIRPDVA